MAWHLRGDQIRTTQIRILLGTQASLTWKDMLLSVQLKNGRNTISFSLGQNAFEVATDAPQFSDVAERMMGRRPSLAKLEEAEAAMANQSFREVHFIGDPQRGTFRVEALTSPNYL